MNKRYYRKYIEKIINENPSAITIKRKEEIDDGYGGTIIKDVEVNETVRFYNRKSRREVVTDYGITYTGVQIIKILALYNADIKKKDTFKHEGITYRVLFVENYFDICKQIELEVIK